MSQVPSKFLLEGSFYALEQCGHLLRSASILFDEMQFSSSIVLAAFAWEELGRSRILLDLLKKALFQQQTVTLKQIENLCGEHVSKQQWGQVARITRGSKDDRVTQLIKTTISVKPDGPEGGVFLKAWQELKAVAARLAKKTPEKRHRKRKKALYVEPSETGLGWSCPCQQFDAQESEFFLLDAINDYSIAVEDMKREIVDVKEGAMRDLITSWPGRPEMPPLPWPTRQFP